MKKILLSLAAVAMVGAFAFADGPAVTVNGDISAFTSVNKDATAVNGNMGRVRYYVGVPAGDFVKVNLDVRDDGVGTTGSTLKFDQVYATTDVAKALGLEGVNITLTGGNYENWMANWNAATSTHRARYVEAFAVGHEAVGLGLNMGVDQYATLLTYAGYANGSLSTYKFGLQLGKVLDGLNAIASYSGSMYGTAKYWKVEGGYTFAVGDATVYIPASFLNDMIAKTYSWGSGVKASVAGFTGAVELGSADAKTNALDCLDVHLSYDMKNLGVYAKSFMDPSKKVRGGDFFEAVDLGASYKLGNNKVYLGYVIDAGKAESIMVTDDDSTARAGVTGGGAYLAWRVQF